jgi:hypothetical protein
MKLKVPEIIYVQKGSQLLSRNPIQRWRRATVVLDKVTALHHCKDQTISLTFLFSRYILVN